MEWEYITNQTGLTLTAYSGYDPEPEIPDEIYGIAVTVLGESIFRNNNTIKRIKVPNSVTSIGASAFQGCTSLEDIQLSRNLLRIETNTFRYCTSLKKIELPDRMTAIGSYSFSGCIELEAIDIPDSVTSIGASAFDDCQKLAEVKISKNVNSIGADSFRNTPWIAAQTQEYLLVGNSVLLLWNGRDPIAEIPYGVTMITDAFSGNIYVESVEIPGSVTRIGPNAFRDAVNLKNVSIPDTVTAIDSDAFNGCRSLRSIDLPESIRTIGSSAFRGCEKLMQIELPSKLSSLSSYVFSNCDVLTDVVIPPSVTTIHLQAFSESPSVRFRVTYDSAGEEFAQQNLIPYTYYLQQNKDFIYSKNENGIQILKYIGNLFDVDIPSEIDGFPVTRINTAAFQNNPIAKRITIPDTVTAVGDWAFSYMDSLVSVQLSSELVSLGDDAFTGSVQLDEIILPESIEEIGLEPFEGIDGLLICAAEGSQTQQKLSAMGYLVSPLDVCLNGTGNTGSDSVPGITTVIPEEALTVPTMDNAAVLFSETPALILTEIPTEMTTPTLTPTPTEIPSETPTATQVVTPAATLSPTPVILDLIRFEQGVTEITKEMMENAAPEVTLIIPDSVIDIDEDILAGHNLTIVSEIGSAAEAFARKWDIKFLVAAWYELNAEMTENER